MADQPQPITAATALLGDSWGSRVGLTTSWIIILALAFIFVSNFRETYPNSYADVVQWGFISIALSYYTITRGLQGIPDFLTFYGCSSKIPHYLVSNETAMSCVVAQGIALATPLWFLFFVWLRFFEACDNRFAIADSSTYLSYVWQTSSDEEKMKKIVTDNKSKYTKFLLWGTVVVYVMSILYMYSKVTNARKIHNFVVKELQVMGFDKKESMHIAIDKET
jgi:hypothetical protein